MEVASDYVQTEDGRLLMEIAGTSRGSEYDVLIVVGHAALNGVLEVALLDGFEPTAGDSFDLLDVGSLTGVFDHLELPELTSGLDWDTSKLYVNGSLSIVPEPYGVMLLVAGMTAFLSARRRNVTS